MVSMSIVKAHFSKKRLIFGKHGSLSQRTAAGGAKSWIVRLLLTSERHGSIVAAATFGLPETMGGERNWDYRYTWIRDASFTLYALIRLEFVNESKAFNKWLEDRCRELGPNEVLQIMFAVDGRRHLPETILSHWEGHRKSSPVRIRNGAAESAATRYLW